MVNAIIPYGLKGHSLEGIYPYNANPRKYWLSVSSTHSIKKFPQNHDFFESLTHCTCMERWNHPNLWKLILNKKKKIAKLQHMNYKDVAKLYQACKFLLACTEITFRLHTKHHVMPDTI